MVQEADNMTEHHQTLCIMVYHASFYSVREHVTKRIMVADYFKRPMEQAFSRDNGS